MPQVELKHVRKAYGASAVIHGVSLAIEQGEFCVFVGPSGCGKSTLLRMIAGLEEVSEGDVIIGGRLMNDEEPSDRGVAMVFQSYALYPHMSVADNMSFGLRMAGRPRAEIDEKVGRAARILQLDHLLDRKPANLSGGQRQRVAIGRAIVRNPDVFLFDEPLSNLDAELRVQMRVEIAKLHRTLGNTMIYVTHDQTEALTLADKIVVLRAGKIEQVGSPLDLYEDPDNAFVAGFIGSPRMNFLKAVVVDGGGAVSVGGTTVNIGHLASRLEEGRELQLGIRPEHLAAATGAALTLTADVTERLGPTNYVHGSLPTGEQIVAEQRDRQAEFRQVLTVRFEAEKIRLFDGSGVRIR
ncbi:ABC transporter ATP-binding protein [Labrys okinawensis]|uniref:ABC transporter ATP-binding protein n=1 Tax=Labrys okinawensis TaxID=346911 RepID=A0A2S9Q3R3_9HYPH|nr:sn-glycerol-3-phosphate ABC transporter ATP-binding protein UgpC [Labrys okinawensis]PRH83969.1 ABC transporter ATP-binding protein [Labrys okinawensis]